MQISIARKYCRSCGEMTRAERYTRPLGCGDLVMVLATFGLWIPIRMLIGHVTHPWTCSACGARVYPSAVPRGARGKHG